MLAGIASLVFIPLLAIAMAHAMWLFGSTFPMQTEADLAKLVVGRKGITRMPHKLSILVVTIAIGVIGIWALLLSDPAPNIVLGIGGIVFSLIFLARGVAPYTPAWQSALPEPAFQHSDRRFYGPVSLYIGVGFAVLTFLHLTPLAD